MAISLHQLIQERYANFVHWAANSGLLRIFGVTGPPVTSCRPDTLFFLGNPKTKALGLERGQAGKL